MAEAPEHLAHRLGVATNPDNPAAIEPHLGFQHRWNLQQVVGGGIKEKKTHGGKHPHKGHDPGQFLQVPEPQAVVAVGKEITHQQHRRRNAQGGKQQPPGPGADLCFPPGPQGRPTAVNHCEAQEQGQHHQLGIK